MRIFPIIVTYMTDIKDCNTYKSLICHYAERPMLIYDNSPIPINAKYKNKKTLYFHDKNNGGVSRAYNYGAKEAKRLGCFDFILLLDQDTIFEKDYIDKLENCVNIYKDINVFVPKIKYGKNRSFSPVLFKYMTLKGIDIESGILSLNKYIPVNSGACINLNSFITVSGYNEKIKLDFADFDFFMRLKKYSDKFFLMDSTACQDFSNEETDTEKLFCRYILYIKGALNTSFKSKCSFHVLRHTISLTLRTKKFIFIKYYINKYLFKK